MLMEYSSLSIVFIYLEMFENCDMATVYNTLMDLTGDLGPRPHLIHRLYRNAIPHCNCFLNSSEHKSIGVSGIYSKHYSTGTLVWV